MRTVLLLLLLLPHLLILLWLLLWLLLMLVLRPLLLPLQYPEACNCPRANISVGRIDHGEMVSSALHRRVSRPYWLPAAVLCLNALPVGGCPPPPPLCL